MTKPIGILGGTFDPVHHGHLRLAVECLERLALAEVRLVPLYTPPHRQPPRAAPEHRMAMLKTAAGTTDNLIVDDCEIRRKSISYTIETVSTLRENNKVTPLCLLIGTDAFNTLHTWYRWESLLDYVHLVITERPGVAPLPVHEGLRTLLEKNVIDDVSSLHTMCNGKIFRLQMPWLDISATRIRDMLRMQHNPAYLLPDGVIDYIRAHRLYAGT